MYKRQVLEAARRALAECRSGKGPVLLELLTYRRTGHSRRDACNYQPQEEQERWLARDPIEILKQHLLERGDVEETELQTIREDVLARIEASVEQARRAPQPSVDELTTDVFA